ncbi:MAG: GAF domain-containing protein [Elusimicrobia bacterium]|nr:GAF domain-containing protein [Elusimicrobiota bacterium]
MKNLSTKKELDLLHKITHILSNTIELPDLLHQIARLIVSVMETDSCLIYLYDDHKEVLILSGSHNPHSESIGKIKMKLGEGITGWVGNHKKSVVIPQKAYQDSRFKYFSTLPEDRYESFLSVPLLRKSLLVGVIDLQTKKPRQYRDSEIELLTTISKLVAGSIENARLYSETKAWAKQIETLSQVSRLVAGKSYLDEILRLIVLITAESLGFKICSLMLLDEEKRELSIAATQSLSEDYRKKPPLKVSESLSGRAVLEKKPIAVLDIHKEREYQYPEIAKQEGLSSLLSVPMMIKDRCIGVLNCYTPEPHHFTEMEIKMLASVAHQAAIAIENTRLMEDALATKGELEARKLIEKAKGILMKEKKLSEEDAFREIRKTSMDKRKTMKEIAEAILLAGELKGHNT